MRSRPERTRLLLASAAVFQLAASPSFAQSDPADPWQPFNRKMFGLEETLDRHVFGPLARSYSHTPSGIRRALMNFTSNLTEPVVFANDVLQGHIVQAAKTVGRLTVNSTVGLAGFFDVAQHNHMPHHDNTFGTTLGRWGASPGPYIFLPLIGPSTFRDTLGSVVDIGLNPLTYARYPGRRGVQVTTTVVGGLNTRVEAQQQLETIRATSTDPYATIRSYFLQNRRSEITGGEVNIEQLPEFDDGGESAPATTPAPPGSVSPTPAPPVSVPQPAAPVPSVPGEAGALPRPATGGEPSPPPPTAAPTPPPAPIAPPAGEAPQTAPAPAPEPLTPLPEEAPPAPAPAP